MTNPDQPDEQPGGQVYGLNADPMPKGWTPLEAVVVLKALDEEGEVSLLFRGTDGLAPWDTVGMLIAVLDEERDALRDSSIDEDEDEDGDS